MPVPFIENEAVKVANGDTLNADELQRYRDWFRSTSALINGLFNRSGVSGNVDNLSEITPKLGSVYAGEFITPKDGATSFVPTDTGFTGSFMAAQGYEFDGVNYKVGSVKEGVLGVGFNEDGQEVFGAGAGNLSVTGMGITGAGVLISFSYTSADGIQFGALETLPGQGVVFVTIGNAEELTIADDDFDSGAFGSGWTSVAGSPAFSSLNPYEGSGYSLVLDGAADAIQSDYFATSAGSNRLFDLWVLDENNGLASVIETTIEYFNVSSVSLGTEVVLFDLDGDGKQKRIALLFPGIAPSNTVKAKIKIQKTNGTAHSVYLQKIGVLSGEGTMIRNNIMLAKIVTLSQQLNINSTIPRIRMTDTTTSAKSLTIEVDGNKADFRESAGAAASLLQLDLANNFVGVAMAAARTLDVTGTFGVTGAATLGSTLAVTGVATFTGNPIITNATPSLAFTDTTGSAKSLTIAVDANKADFRESAGAAASLLQLDLANLRVGVKMSATRTLDVTGDFGVTGAATLGSTLAVTGHVTFEGVTSTGATGTGNLVFATSPALTTPNLGTPSALTLTNATGLPLATGVTGILPSANGGNGVSNATQTYTPSLTNVTNVAASSAVVCQYARNGDLVTVSGRVDIDPTTGTTASELGISLPIASSFTTTAKCGGTAASRLAAAFGEISADTANNRAKLSWTTSADVANRSWWFSFSYLVQ